VKGDTDCASLMQTETEKNSIIITKKQVNLPDECIRLIKDYCMHKDDFMTCKKYYKTILNISLVNKQFREIFQMDKRELERESIDEEEQQICKSDAKSKYGLTDKDMEDIDYIEKYHRFHRVTMKLYSIVDIMNKACEKYGSYENFIKEKREKQKKAIQKREEAERQIEKRRTELKDAMERQGIRLRTDSVLCNNYIEKNIGSIDHIVNVMVEMDFYFKYTNYDTEYSREKDNYWRQQHYISDDDRIDISSTAKRRALQKWCLRFTNVESALLSNYLPDSLREKVRQIFVENQRQRQRNQQQSIVLS